MFLGRCPVYLTVIVSALMIMGPASAAFAGWRTSCSEMDIPIYIPQEPHIKPSHSLPTSHSPAASAISASSASSNAAQPDKLEKTPKPIYLRFLANDKLYPDVPDKPIEKKPVNQGRQEVPWIGPVKKYEIVPQLVGVWATYPIRSESVNLSGPMEITYVLGNKADDQDLSGTVTFTIMVDSQTVVDKVSQDFKLPRSQNKRFEVNLKVNAITLEKTQTLTVKVEIAYGTTSGESPLEFWVDGTYHEDGDYTTYLQALADSINIADYGFREDGWHFTFVDSFGLDWTYEGRRTTRMKGTFDGKPFNARNATVSPGTDPGTTRVDFKNWLISPDNHTVYISLIYNKEESKFEFIIYQPRDTSFLRGFLYKMRIMALYISIAAVILGVVGFVVYRNILMPYLYGEGYENEEIDYDEYDEYEDYIDSDTMGEEYDEYEGEEEDDDERYY